MDPEPLRLVEIPFSEIQLFEVVGKGAFGVVRRSLRNGKEVAVKIIDSQEGKRSLMAEVKQLSRVHHPQIVTLYGICLHESLLHLVMEYAPIGSLHDLLHGTRNYQQLKYTLAHALSWCLQCARGVEYLHGMKPKPIVHRDLKPQNLLMFDNGLTVKLCDFGTACDARTQMTTNRGSPLWMAPEVFSGERYTEKCDVYSWSIILWQILSRHQPYEQLRGADAYSILFRVHGGMRPNPIAGCPLQLERLMKACWNVDHSARPVITECARIVSAFMRFVSGHDAPLFSVSLAPARQRNASNDAMTGSQQSAASNDRLLIHAPSMQAGGRPQCIVAEIVEDPPLVSRQLSIAVSYMHTPSTSSATGGSQGSMEQRPRNASATNVYPKRSSLDNTAAPGDAAAVAAGEEYPFIIPGGYTPKRDNSFQRGHRRGGSHGDQQSIADFLFGSPAVRPTGGAPASAPRPTPAVASRTPLRRTSPYAQECCAMQTIVKEIGSEMKPIEPIPGNNESVQVYHDHVRCYREFLRVKLEAILLTERKFQLEKDLQARNANNNPSSATLPTLQEEFAKEQRKNHELKNKKQIFTEQLKQLQSGRDTPHRQMAAANRDN